MITISQKLKELLELYKEEPTDELAHEIVQVAEDNVKFDKSRVDIVIEFLEDHFSNREEYCSVYTNNVPRHLSGTFYVDQEMVEFIEMMGAARKLKLFIKNNFSK